MRQYVKIHKNRSDFPLTSQLYLLTPFRYLLVLHVEGGNDLQYKINLAAKILISS